jgi:hypothetical protein
MQSSLLRSAFIALALGITLPVAVTAGTQNENGSALPGTAGQSMDQVLLAADQPSTGSQTSTPSGQTAEPKPATPPEQPQLQPAPAPSMTSVPAAPAQEFGRPSREHISIGLGFHWLTNSAFRNDYKADSSDHEAYTDLSIVPYVGIRTSDLLEIRPALVYILRSETYDYTPPSSGSGIGGVTLKQYSFSESRLGFDVAFLFYLIHGSFFRFSVGPAIGFDMSLGPTESYKYSNSSMDNTIKYNTYIDINVPIHVPFSFDFVPTKNLGFRLSSEIFNVTPNIHYVKQNGTIGTDETVITTRTTLDLTKTLLDFSIGMFLLF